MINKYSGRAFAFQETTREKQNCPQKDNAIYSYSHFDESPDYYDSTPISFFSSHMLKNSPKQ